MISLNIKHKLDVIIAKSNEYDNLWFCYRDCQKEILWGLTPKEYQECIIYITGKLGI